MTNKTKLPGAFCVVIKKQLVTSYCPVPQGSCTFMHKSTGRCMYAHSHPHVHMHMHSPATATMVAEDSTISIQHLASLTGVTTPSVESVQDITKNLLAACKKALL